jgi:hypothetical protein
MAQERCPDAEGQNFAPLRLCGEDLSRLCSSGTQQRPENITGLLARYGRGDKKSLDELMPIVYDELR